MAYPNAFVKLAQSVHLAIKNRYYDDIQSPEGQNYMDQVADWVNMWLDELENVTDQAGNVVKWNFARSVDYTLGTVQSGDTEITTSSDVDSIISTPLRYAMLTSPSGDLLSKWRVVNINQIRSPLDSQEDRIALVGDTIYFSRPITPQEDTGVLSADVTLTLPRIDEPNNEFSVLSMIRPQQLIILGVAKNASLPDLVRGGLSPSFLQRYQDLLNQAILKNGYTSVSDEMSREDLSYVRGVGF